jgi:hypothetical protein
MVRVVGVDPYGRVGRCASFRIQVLEQITFWNVQGRKGRGNWHGRDLENAPSQSGW